MGKLVQRNESPEFQLSIYRDYCTIRIGKNWIVGVIGTTLTALVAIIIKVLQHLN
jgi:hypothetical protein